MKGQMDPISGLFYIFSFIIILVVLQIFFFKGVLSPAVWGIVIIILIAIGFVLAKKLFDKWTIEDPINVLEKKW